MQHLIAAEFQTVAMVTAMSVFIWKYIGFCLLGARIAQSVKRFASRQASGERRQYKTLWYV